MEHTQIEVIKAEVLTLANDLKVIAGKLDFLMALRPVEQPKPVDFENPDLIEEWVDTYAYDFESDFFDAVDVELEANGYGDELTINAVKEVNDSGRNDILRKAIEKYLEWAKNQKETQAEEGSDNDY